MQTFHPDAFLSGHVFAFLMLLSRVGAVLMLFPGIGETYVARRTRMILACLICFLLLEPMLPRFPPMPTSTAELARLIFYEVAVGIFFGLLIRLIQSVLEATGMIIGMQSGLSSATMVNPALATQSPLPSAFLSIVALVLIFLTGIDHLLIRATVSLYDTFPPGGHLPVGDMTQTIIRIANESFTVGIELAAPFLIMGLLLFAAMGILQRLLPNVQLFLILLPVEIWGGLMLMSLTIAGILTLWLRYVDQSLETLFRT